MTALELRQFIRGFLEKNNVKSFWVASAMEWLDRSIYGNHYFLTSLSSPEIVLNREYSCIKKFSFKAKASIPDRNLTGINVVVTYTFDPDLTNGKNHKVSIVHENKV